MNIAYNLQGGGEITLKLLYRDDLHYRRRSGGFGRVLHGRRRHNRARVAQIDLGLGGEVRGVGGLRGGLRLHGRTLSDAFEVIRSGIVFDVRQDRGHLRGSFSDLDDLVVGRRGLAVLGHGQPGPGGRDPRLLAARDRQQRFTRHPRRSDQLVMNVKYRLVANAFSTF